MPTIAELRTQLAATPEGLMVNAVDVEQDVLTNVERIEDAIFSINEALANLRAIQTERAKECSAELQASLASLIASTNVDLLHGILSTPEA